MADIESDVLVVGGSLGGVAAAIRAASMGAQVHLLAETEWVGGQMTSQGVSCPDEWPWIEQGGCTASYQDFRQRVRAHYSDLGITPAAQQQDYFNPGNCWVSGLSMEPAVGQQILRDMLGEQAGITLHLSTHATGAQMNGDSVASVAAEDGAGNALQFVAPMVIDATDLGDLLPLTGTEYVIGAESQADTGEPDAPPVAHPDWIQPFTMPMVLEHYPEGDNDPIPQPDNYAALAAQQQFTWQDGAIDGLFSGNAPWWTYRRIIAAANFPPSVFPRDLALINTQSNDFKGGVIPSGDPQRDLELIEQGRQVTLAYLWWLQNECQAGGRTGFPELHLRGDAFGDGTGLAPQPYIRESRRLLALERVLEQDIVASQQPGIRARFFQDSCGLGNYACDVHPGSTPDPELYLATEPYQVPLGCLIPRRVTNLLAGCKNLGVTHITNGAYRLHPVEWNTGEAAGALAAHCVQASTTPQTVWQDPNRDDPAQSALWAFQKVLLAQGVPLYWWPDVPPGHAAFVATQAIAMWGYWTGAGALTFEPNGALTDDVRTAVNGAVGQTLPWPSSSMSRGDAAVWLAGQMGLV